VKIDAKGLPTASQSTIIIIIMMMVPAKSPPARCTAAYPHRQKIHAPRSHRVDAQVLIGKLFFPSPSSTSARRVKTGTSLGSGVNGSHMKFAQAFRMKRVGVLLAV
jgi:hypothetical protein